MPLHWIYPANFHINLYRSGWKNDRGFDRIVVDISSGQFVPISTDASGFVIKSNTINKVRTRDIGPLIVPNESASAIGPDTQLNGVRLSRGNELIAGISLFDDWARAPITSSNWYKIPSEIQIPEALILVKATRPTSAGATHFTLGPAESMTLRHFIVLLTPLANDSRIVSI